MTETEMTIERALRAAVNQTHDARMVAIGTDEARVAAMDAAHTALAPLITHDRLRSVVATALADYCASLRFCDGPITIH